MFSQKILILSRHSIFAAMRVVVLGKYLDADENACQMLACLIQQQPADEFFLLLPSGFSFKHASANLNIENCLPVTENKFLLRLWLKIKLPFFNVKNKIDLVIGYNGFGALEGKTPKLMLMNEWLFEEAPVAVAKKRRRFLNVYFKGPETASGFICITSKSSKNFLKKLYPLVQENITVISSAPNELYQQQAWEQQEAHRQKHTNGKSYFIYRDNGWAKTEKMLRAFSLFKKRQQSNMLLLIIVRPQEQSFLQHKLQNYKLRQEVLLKSSHEKEVISEIVPAAYAVIHLQNGISFPGWAIAVMDAGVPAVACHSPANQEAFENAVLYIKDESPEALADQLKYLYKDEYLRNSLIAAWQQKKKDYNWPQTVERIWAAAQQAITNG